MFGRKKSSYDPFLGVAAAKAAHASLVAGDWSAARQLLNSGGDQTLYMNLLVQDDVPTEVYQRWAQAQPDSTTYTLLGTKLTGDAWEIRGSGYAESVAEDAWARFRAKLSEAHEATTEATRLGPPSAHAWAAMAQIALGRSAGINTIQGHFDEAHAITPFHTRATTVTLQARCAKWFGDHESMFTFARWVAESAPADAPAQDALVRAHYERWAAMRSEEIASQHYFSQPNVHNDIVRVATRFVEATPSGPAAPEQLTALNWFVFALGESQPRPRSLVAECATRIDGRATEWPWRMFRRNNYASTYRSALKDAVNS